MSRRSGVVRLLASSVALALAAGGCSLLVSGDVPEFQCTGTSPSACPSGMVCDTQSGRCVADAGLAPPDEAGDEDAGGGEDVQDASKDADADAAGPAELGAKCRVDAECKSRLCGSSTMLTTAITLSTGPICTTPCCNSGQCPTSSVCFNGGTGGGYCVPATLAQRTPPASGGKAGGSSCSAHSECRSGLCAGSPKLCLDTCCGDTECLGASVCRVKAGAAPGPSHDIWVCAAPEPGATTIAGDACTNAPAECKSDNCIGSICRPSCSSHATCVAIAGFVSGHCRYGTSGADVLKYCQTTTFSRLANGTTCTNDSDCTYDYCDPELKKCANVCATNADCTAAETCRPSATGTPFLRCVTKP